LYFLEKKKNRLVGMEDVEIRATRGSSVTFDQTMGGG